MAGPLTEKIKRTIAANGPIGLGEYMQLCHFDTDHGVYAARDPIGRTGHFITAPEVSQMFGELIGIWCVAAWQALGEPSPSQLCELGPGRGTLMRDAMRAMANFPQFADAVTVHLVEASATLRARQKALLTGAGREPVWHDETGTLPAGPTVFIANEFLDVLPLRQYAKADGRWRERAVGLDEAGGLAFTLTAGGLDEALLPAGHEQAPDGTIFEIAPAREAVVEQIAVHLAAHGGVALFIDYGHLEPGFGDTFQAVAGHRACDPLAAPGEADLTSHVDFAALAEAARRAGAHVFAPMTQGAFLSGMGLAQRVATLSAGKDASTRAAIAGQAERLADPRAMGELFKVLAIAGRPGLALPPFEGPSA